VGCRASTRFLGYVTIFGETCLPALWSGTFLSSPSKSNSAAASSAKRAHGAVSAWQQLAVIQEYVGRLGAEEGKAHGNPGNTHILQGDYARGCEVMQKALAMFQASGDSASAAVAVQTLTKLQLAQEPGLIPE
jgi:hypothetical protein